MGGEEKKTIDKNVSVIFCDDLIKTSISGVKEEKIEECLDKIIASNTNVTFGNVQYSKRDRRLYFYTDKEISIEAWKTPKSDNNSTMTLTIDVLEEIKRLLLLQEEQENENCISLYQRDDVISLDEVIKVVKLKSKQHEQMLEYYEGEIETLFRTDVEGIQRDVYSYISKYEDYNNSLRVSFKGHYDDDYSRIIFKKDEMGDMHAQKETESFIDVDKIMVGCGEMISRAYDALLPFKDFKTQSCDIKTLNSRFTVNISQYGIDIEYCTFRLSFLSYKEKCNYKCNSQNIINFIKGNEMEIAKKIFVRIEECPEWMHRELYEKRKNQLLKKKQVEEQKNNHECKTTKENQKKKKLGFSFWKKDKA